MEREGQYDEAARSIVSVVVAGDNGCNQLPKSMGTELVIIARLELEQAAGSKSVAGPAAAPRPAPGPAPAPRQNTTNEFY